MDYLHLKVRRIKPDRQTGVPVRCSLPHVIASSLFVGVTAKVEVRTHILYPPKGDTTVNAQTTETGEQGEPKRTRRTGRAFLVANGDFPPSSNASANGRGENETSERQSRLVVAPPDSGPLQLFLSLHPSPPNGRTTLSHAPFPYHPAPGKRHTHQRTSEQGGQREPRPLCGLALPMGPPRVATGVSKSHRRRRRSTRRLLCAVACFAVWLLLYRDHRHPFVAGPFSSFVPAGEGAGENPVEFTYTIQYCRQYERKDRPGNLRDSCARLQHHHPASRTSLQ